MPNLPEMQYRPLGNSGLEVSRLTLGSWLTYGADTDEKTSFACLDAALAAGITTIDTADVYNQGGAETLIGKWLKQHTRRHIVLATKAFFPMSEHRLDKGLSRRYLRNAVQASLERLQTDYIDLYQCHRYDYQTPLEEVCETMDNLIRRGYIHHWGVSQWTAVQITNAVRLCEQNGWHKPVSNQPIYNMLNRSLEVDVMAVCETEGLGLLTFSPLSQGILTGKYTREHIPEDSRAGKPGTSQWFNHKRLTEENFRRLDKLRPLAQQLGCNLSQLAIAWCLRVQPVTTVILGASKPEQVTENVAALTVALDAEVQAEIESILGNAPIDQYTGNRTGWGVAPGI